MRRQGASSSPLPYVAIGSLRVCPITPPQNLSTASDFEYSIYPYLYRSDRTVLLPCQLQVYCHQLKSLSYDAKRMELYTRLC